MKSIARVRQLAPALIVLAGLLFGAGAAAQMSEVEILMILMGAGIEDPSGEAAAMMRRSDVPAAAAAPAGAFSSIDVPGATATRALGINASGEIVGAYTDATGTWGYLWDEGNVTNIQVPGSITTEAWGINPRGDIVGRYRRASDPNTYGFLLSGGAFTDISVGQHLHTLPIKISPSREIVGCFHDTDFLRDMRGYVQRGDTVSSFEALPSTMHNGVARSGRMVAGISFQSAALVHGYMLNRDVYTQFDYPGAMFTQAWDLNASGKVVGYFNAVDSHGFLLDRDGFTQIDVPDAGWTRIFGINPRGDMVGSYADASGRVHGFLLVRGRIE